MWFGGRANPMNRVHSGYPTVNQRLDTACMDKQDEQRTPRNANQFSWIKFGIPVVQIKPEAQDDPSPPDTLKCNGAKPSNIKGKNVIIFGETGVGKSSVINLMADAEVAKTSPDAEGCTLQATKHSFTLPSEVTLHIYDTVGLNEPEMGVNTFFGAIEKANQLVRSLHDAGGVDLLLFCIRGARITSMTERNYRLFFEFLCEKRVPLSLVITHLEYEPGAMEDWWGRNEKTFEEYGIESIAHACITAAPARVESLAPKRAESRTALHKMLDSSLSSLGEPYVKDTPGWFFRVVTMLRSFVTKNLQKKALSKKLQDSCGLSPKEAQQLVDKLVKGR